MNNEKLKRITVNPNGILVAPDKTKLGKFTEDKEKIFLKNVQTCRRDPDTGVVYDMSGEAIGILIKIPNSALAKHLRGGESKVIPTPKAKESKKDNSNIPLVKRPVIDDVYKPGKDSALIVSGQLSKQLYGDNRRVVTAATMALDNVNKKNKWKYNTWEELCANEDLSEKFLAEYDPYIDWYGFLQTHKNKVFTSKFEKKYWKRLLVRSLGIV